MEDKQGSVETDVESEAEEIIIKPKRARVFSSSDDDECPTFEPLKDVTNIEPETSSAHVETKTSKFGLKSSLITDSDVEYDNCSDHHDETSAAPIPDINNDNEADRREELQEEPKKKSRKSTKKLLDAKLEIRSETQRLERERTVHLPYHRPKQRSLREFLSRKKNQLDENSLRLSSPNMISTWEGIDKSIREMPQFFKSESEDESGHESEHDTQQVENLTEPLNVDSEIIIENDKLPNAADENIEKLQCDGEDCKTYIAEESFADDRGSIEPITDVPVLSRKEKTSKWLEDIAAYEKRESLKTKIQLSPTILDKVPILSNDMDDFVDLEISSKIETKPGVQQLMDRMFKGLQKNQVTKPQSVTTTFTEKDELGNIKNVGVETVSFSQSAVVLENDKPGVRRQQLKEKLKMEIEAKWEKEFKERCAVEPVKDGFENNAEEDELEPGLEEEESSTESETEPDEEEEEEVMDKPRATCVFGDSEAEESNADEDDGCDGDDETEQDDDHSQQEEIDCSLLPAFQPGGGLLMGGSMLSQQSQPLPIRPTSPLSSPTASTQHVVTPTLNRDDVGIPSKSELIDTSVKKNLFGDDENVPGDRDGNEDDEDPFLFVSGVFPATTATTATIEPKISQSHPKRIIVPEESEDSRGVESNHEVVADDDDDVKSTLRESTVLDDDDGEITVKKKNQQLVFSDDEDDDAPSAELKETVDSDEEHSNNEQDLDDVNYDSEENEIRPGEFFEKEAELTESEWSGDEDEQGLDTFEAEAGDADVFDENQVASQLEKIHMRQVLDEDARNVRRLQELFFEDGDLYTEGGPREKNFRWKNIDGFDWNSVYKGEEGDVGDVVELSDRAKIRFEKKRFLAQQGDKLEAMEELTEEKCSVLVLGRQMLQRLQPQPTTIPTKPLKSVSRGSFLSKDKNFLSRIARVTAGGSDAPLLGASHSRNFAFAVQEKSETVSSYKESLKRKAEINHEVVKRQKMVCQDSFLDQLRPTEATPLL